MSEAAPQIAFVVPAYNEEALIGACLNAIGRELALAGSAAEVVVVDNASTDRTAQIAGSFPFVRVIREPHKGIVFARRAGLSATSAELVANVDADAVPCEGWLQRVLDAFANDPDLVCLSGPFLFDGMRPMPGAATRMAYQAMHRASRVLGFLRIGAIVQGGNFVFRRSAWQRAGGYDTTIAFYGEDTDIARRLSKVGKVRWDPLLRSVTSARRFTRQGWWRTSALYGLNFASVLLRGKPATRRYEDFR